MSGFKFNENELKKMVNQAVAEKAKDTQTLLDRLHRRYSGRPVNEVKAALVREWRRDGGKISDTEARDWATLISNGTRIVLKVKR